MPAIDHYFAWINGRYRLVLRIRAKRITLPWRQPRLLDPLDR